MTLRYDTKTFATPTSVKIVSPLNRTRLANGPCPTDRTVRTYLSQFRISNQQTEPKSASPESRAEIIDQESRTGPITILSNYFSITIRHI